MGHGRPAAYVLAAAGMPAFAVVAVAGTRTGDTKPWQLLLIAAAVAPTIVLGLLLARRRPDLPIGALLVCVGVVPLFVFALEAWGSTFGTNDPWPFAQQAAYLSASDWVWFYASPALLAVFFPDGRLPSPRWRWLLVAWPIVLVTAQTMIVLDATTYVSGGGQTPGEPPFSIPRSVVLAVGWSALFAMMGLLIASAAAMVVRYRRADVVVRRQIRWFALSAVLIPLVLLTCWISIWFTDQPSAIVAGGLLVVFVAMPLATTVAILRHDLYDIDRVFSRTVSYTVLTGLLAALFALTALGVGLFLGRDSAPAAAVATLVCAAAFGPFRRRVQAAVDRRFDRDHHHAIAEIERFVARVREGYAQPEQVEDALQRALRDPRVRVGYVINAEGGSITLDGSGQRIEAPSQDRHEIVFAGRQLGWLTYRGRPSLLRDVLDAAHLPLEVARARVEVQAALAETRASRARIVAAGYDERRRLQRDLHDGAQQRLVAIGLSLRLAQRQLSRDDVVYGQLERTVDDLQDAVTELRRISQGVRPSGLDDGLPAALRNLVRSSPVPVELHVTGDSINDDVATTAYYVAAEAMTNALKHANPNRLGIELSRVNGSLRISVSDDGCGGAAVVPGSGLAGLADRVAASGGVLEVSSNGGGGTRVEATLPLRQ